MYINYKVGGERDEQPTDKCDDCEQVLKFSAEDCTEVRDGCVSEDKKGVFLISCSVLKILTLLFKFFF